MVQVLGQLHHALPTWRMVPHDGSTVFTTTATNSESSSTEVDDEGSRTVSG
jgi:hypothetical protein